GLFEHLDVVPPVPKQLGFALDDRVFAAPLAIAVMDYEDAHRQERTDRGIYSLPVWRRQIRQRSAGIQRIQEHASRYRPDPHMLAESVQEPGSGIPPNAYPACYYPAIWQCH